MSGRSRGRVDLTAAARAYEAAELAADELVTAEVAAFDRWQDALGASQVAMREADAAWRAYRSAAGGRAGVERSEVRA